MIPHQWYVVLTSKEVRRKPVGVTRFGEKMVFWRDEAGHVSCLLDRCPHRGVELSKGKVVGDHLQCPFHGFEYDTSGLAMLIPANGRNGRLPKALRVAGYPTHEAHGFIWIWWGEDPPADLAPPKFFDDLDANFTSATIQQRWDTHYSRVIENQLDVMHLPFLHHNTIGKGNRTVVDGPGLEWVGDDEFRIYVFNRHDDGTQPLKPNQVRVPPANGIRIDFIFPNLWQNRLGEDVRIVAAFVPVDSGFTLLYLRFYQRFLRLPVLRSIVTWAAMPMNWFIAHQDRRVVITHQPQSSGLRIGEVLVQGDLPIVEYRRRRQQLLDNVERRLA